MKKRIDIVCPVFREEEAISTFHRALLEFTEPLGERFEFRYLYVVDPSPDRTEAILRDLASHDPRVGVIVMSRRFGHQAALIAGLDAADGDAVVMLDSDMQHPPGLIPTLLEHWENGADIVQALRQDRETISFGRRLTSALFYRAFERLSKIGINSGAADYRLLTRKVVEVFRERLREHNPFLRGLVSWIGYKIVYVPFVPDRRAAGQSHYSLSTLGVFALNGICSFSKVPLRICIFIGLGFAVLSMVLGVVLVLDYVLAQDPRAPGWASLFALLAFASSVNLFFLGVLGEYIGLIFDEVKDRPLYLVGRTYGAAPSARASDRA
jgi:polyisoprenyl-phosphate glycosyltransferase